MTRGRWDWNCKTGCIPSGRFVSARPFAVPLKKSRSVYATDLPKANTPMPGSPPTPSTRQKPRDFRFRHGPETPTALRQSPGSPSPLPTSAFSPCVTVRRPSRTVISSRPWSICRSTCDPAGHLYPPNNDAARMPSASGVSASAAPPNSRSCGQRNRIPGHRRDPTLSSRPKADWPAPSANSTKLCLPFCAFCAILRLLIHVWIAHRNPDSIERLFRGEIQWRGSTSGGGACGGNARCRFRRSQRTAVGK